MTFQIHGNFSRPMNQYDLLTTLPSNLADMLLLLKPASESIWVRSAWLIRLPSFISISRSLIALM